MKKEIAEKAIEVLGTYDMSDDNEDKEFIEAVQAAIESLKKEIPREFTIYENSDEDEDGRPYVMRMYCCPKCHKGFRTIVPHYYCDYCGQKIEEK